MLDWTVRTAAANLKEESLSATLQRYHDVPFHRMSPGDRHQYLNAWSLIFWGLFQTAFKCPQYFDAAAALYCIFDFSFSSIFVKCSVFKLASWPGYLNHEQAVLAFLISAAADL